MIEFIYNGKTFYADNLDKKLKRLKINKGDIQIVGETVFKKKETPADTTIYYKIVFWEPSDNGTYVTYIQRDEEIPTKEEFFKYHIWNEETKTGIRNHTEEWLNEIYFLPGVPEYPIRIDLNDKPKLELQYIISDNKIESVIEL